MAAATASGAAAPQVNQDPTGAQIDTDAFKLLYPAQFHERFFEAGVRSDGRTLGRARPLTIGLGAVSTALGSCLAKLGSTTVLAGLRAHIGECPEGSPKEGVFKINVELAPFALSDTRSGPAQDLLAKLTQRLQATLSPLQLAKQLGISDGKAAFHAQLDAYVLDADGAAFDALLLASVATLLSARLPAVKEDENGKVRVAKRQETGEQPGKRLELRHVPVSVTCALVGGKYLLLDPTSDEERISDSSVCVVLDQHSKLHGVYKAGGTVSANGLTFLKCIESAKLRYKQVSDQLAQALQAADATQADAMQE